MNLSKNVFLVVASFVSICISRRLRPSRCKLAELFQPGGAGEVHSKDLPMGRSKFGSRGPSRVMLGFRMSHGFIESLESYLRCCKVTRRASGLPKVFVNRRLLLHTYLLLGVYT